MNNQICDSAQRLKELMKMFDLKQADICDRTGIDKSVISLYVNGNRVPRQDKLSIIADAYNIDPTWLMGYDVPMARKTDNIRDIEISNITKAAAASSETRRALTMFINLPAKQQEVVTNLLDLLSNH